MDFYTILDQVIALLRQRQRVSYRALKRQFQLDDDYLEDLKVELIRVQQLAVDQEGEMLMWTGDAGGASARLPTTPPPARQPAPEGAHPSQGEPSLATSRSPDAERRQLTMLFCDLVESTALSGQLDPEDLREVVRAYQRACSEVITRFDGHIAQLLGDGLLVYFGYPFAHEDDAQRAVRTGLGMVEAIATLNTHVAQTKGTILAVRLGIHTGLVVVGAMGGYGRQEQLALGETPNIAARIQGLAAPNTVAISDATYHLVQGYFACEALGAQTLRGVAQPLQVYRVLAASGVHSRLDVAQTRGLTPLVGRDQEVGVLFERWEHAKAGHGHVVLLNGEAGIGKSRLVQVLKEHVTGEHHVRLECRSSPYYQNTALYPLVDLLQRTLRWQPHHTPEEKLATLEQELRQYRLPVEESVQLLAPLLALAIPEHRYPPLHLSPQRQRQQTLEALVALLFEQAERSPVLFILEDLHWSDPSTLEWLTLVIDQIPTTAILMILTCRPHFQPRWHPRPYLTEMTVHRLSQPQMERMTAQVAGGKTLPQEVMHQIIARSDGVPLFVEEITKSLLESGQLTDVNGHYELTGSLRTLAIPVTLQDSLMARLDRLAAVKTVAQLGATIGRQFAYDLLQAISPLDQGTLQQGLRQLVEAELLYQRGLPPQATYLFKHALIQEAAYQSLLRSTRQHYHQRIAQVLEERFRETAETQPELLAQHYTEAGCSEQAIVYWQRAGQHASDRSAHVEAIGHLTQGLEMLKALPDTPKRAQQELDVHILLGQALLVTKGQAAPEVGHTYSRARELCQQVGETSQLFRVLYGLWHFHIVRAEYQTVRQLSEELLTLAQHMQDPTYLLGAHYVLGGALCCVGEFAAAREQWEQGLTLYDPQQHPAHIFLYGFDLGVFCLCWTPHALWSLGYPDQALALSRKAVALAQELTHPISLAVALDYATIFHQFRREPQAVSERAEAAITLCTEQGFAYYLAWGMTMQGWAHVTQSQDEASLAQIRRGLAALQATRAAVRLPYYMALLAEACGQTGHAGEGLTLLAEALAQAHHTGESWTEAELYRLQGELLLSLSADNHTKAEGYFHHALSLTRQQQAKSLELRAAMSLSRVWQSQGKRAEAYALLAPIYGWFTEGFDTPDLQDAKALLEALA